MVFGMCMTFVQVNTLMVRGFQKSLKIGVWLEKYLNLIFP